MQTEEHSAPAENSMTENPSAPEHPVPDSPSDDNIIPARKAYSGAQLNLALFYLFYIFVAMIIEHFLPESRS